jgi:hypothetical protein
MSPITQWRLTLTHRTSKRLRSIGPAEEGDPHQRFSVGAVIDSVAEAGLPHSSDLSQSLLLSILSSHLE